MTKVAEQLVKQLRRAESHERLEIVFEVLQALAENGKAPFGLCGTRGHWDCTGLSSGFQVCHGIRTSNPFRRNKSQEHARSWPNQHRWDNKESRERVPFHCISVDPKDSRLKFTLPQWEKRRQKHRSFFNFKLHWAPVQSLFGPFT